MPIWYRLLLLFAALVLASGAIITSLRAFQRAKSFYRSFLGLYLLAALFIGVVTAGVAIPFDISGTGFFWGRLLPLLSGLVLASGAIVTSIRFQEEANTSLRNFVALYFLVALILSFMATVVALFAP